MKNGLLRPKKVDLTDTEEEEEDIEGELGHSSLLFPNLDTRAISVTQ